MSKLTICDNCRRIIKKGEKKSILGMTEVIEGASSEQYPTDFESLLKQHSQDYDDVKMHELCSTCKKILNYLFKMTKKEQQDILKKLNKLYDIEGNKGNKK